MTTSLIGTSPAASSARGDRVAKTSSWRDVTARYQQIEPRRAFLQLGITLALLTAGFVAAGFAMRWSYWLTLLCIVPTGGLLMRTFIIMHDCAHGSFLPSRRANDAIGWFTGMLTLTPFAQWRRDHALHHASSGDLDRRGHGDVETITVREYLALSRWDRFWYRMRRNPLALLSVGPLWLLTTNRFPSGDVASRDKQVVSVWSTNAVIAVGIAASIAFGVLPAVLMIYLPALYVAGVMGVFLFYVQHQFEQAYWEPHANWTYADAAIAGSSYLKLPRPLRWLTGSIGLHHVHHLGPKIPNYNLQRCHDENATFHRVTTITLRDAVRTFRLALWDEQLGRLVRFRDVAPQAGCPTSTGT